MADAGLEELSVSEKALLAEAGYFHGQLWRRAAEELLGAASAARGSFLVREAAPELVLSVRHQDDYGGPDVVAHIRVGLDYRGYFTVDGAFFFTKIQSLVLQHVESGRPAVHGSLIVLKRPLGRAPWELLPQQLELGPLLVQGRFGSVHRGLLRKPTPLIVAVKSCRVAQSRQTKRLFLSDAMALQLIGPHAALVSFHGCSLLEDDMKMVKELSTLGSLRLRLADAPPGHLEGTRIGLAVAAAVQAVHSAGLIHLDITSLNFFLFPPAASPVVKLGNFYHARQSSGWSLGVGGGRLLEPRWAAPEVLSESEVTAASDVWSLGVVVWELLGGDGAGPWAGLEGGAALLTALRGGRRLDTSLVSRQVASVLADCWDADPTRRPSPDLVQDALHSQLRFYGHGPVTKA